MKRWHGVLAVLDREAEQDGRGIATGALVYALLPVPLMRQEADDGLHSMSETVGQIERVEETDGLLTAWGQIKDGYAGQTLSGGIDVAIGQTESNGTEYGLTVQRGVLTGFHIHSSPVWPEVRIEVEA